MSRLIDADELHGMEKLLSTSAKTPESKFLMEQVLFDILNVPTIDPVHAAGACYCRECKFLNSLLNTFECGNPDGMDETIDPNTDFCCRGERSEQNA